MIDKKRLSDQHYYAIASKATILKPEQLNVHEDKCQKDALASGKVFDAMDGCAKFGLDADQLDAEWAKTKAAKKLVKFVGGFYCGDHSALRWWWSVGWCRGGAVCGAVCLLWLRWLFLVVFVRRCRCLCRRCGLCWWWRVFFFLWFSLGKKEKGEERRRTGIPHITCNLFAFAEVELVNTGGNLQTQHIDDAQARVVAQCAPE